ncbi:MAG: T9SS type A sorting domain-containing protein [Bacteroidia bacterium]
MRKLYVSLCLLLASALPAVAQFNVTFQVDMNTQAVVDDTVSVAGNFQVAAGFASDWTPGITRLTDANADGVYDLTVQLPAGSYEYKFLNGAAWGTDEGVPGACNVNGNRGMTISGDTTLSLVCFGSCTACPVGVDTVDVTFQVEMRYLTLASMVTIAGDFQNDVPGAGWSDWTPGITELTDPNNDSVYTLTVRLPEGTYAYKYINGTAWGQDESVPGACAVNNNRELIVTGPGPITVPVHCFASCSACVAPLPAINVTFRVDMSNEIVNSGGVFVAGSFQNPAWVKDTLLMTDVDADGIYEHTEAIVPNEYQFKYYNGPGGDADGETADFLALGCGVSNGLGGFNRLLNIVGRTTDTILPVWEYNSCTTVATGVAEQEGTTFNVYPNPFSSTTVIELNRWERSAFDLRVVSVTGQVMMERNGLRSSRVEISREGLESGLYFVELKDAKGRRTTQKIVVQ